MDILFYILVGLSGLGCILYIIGEIRGDDEGKGFKGMGMLIGIPFCLLMVFLMPGYFN